MKKLYLIGVIVVFLFILILSLPQIAATCVWYPPVSGTMNASFVLFQASGLGVILGGLLVLFWKIAKQKPEGDEDDEGGSEGGGGSEA